MPHASRRLGWIPVAACAIVAVACGGGSATTTGDPVATITVTGISQTLLVGATGQASAVADDASGAVVNTTFTWSSSNPAVATVTAAGIVTGVTPGSTTISASAQGKSGTLMVTVASPDPTVANIAVTGIAQALVVGTNGTAVATATDASGTVLSRTFTWTTSDATVATVAADGTVAAVSAGSTTITASADGKSGTLMVTVNNRVPSVTGVSPASVTAGAPAQTLTVQGSGFAATSVVRWNGTSLTTTFGSSTQLTAQLPAGDLAAASTASVTVFNPAPGGGTSSAQPFTVSPLGSNPVPAITAVLPPSAAAGSAAFALTVTGSNFLSTSTVQWNGALRPTTFVSATQLVAQIGAGDLLSAANIAITVVNPAPGGGASAPVAFAVYTSLPTLTYAQLPVALAASVDSSISADAQAAAVTITSPLVIGGGVNFAVVSPLGRGPRALLARHRAAARLSSSGNCPILGPANPAVNSDGLPLSLVTYTYLLSQCTEDQYTSQEGIVTLSDPDPTTSAYTYDVNVPNYVGRVGDSTGTIKDSITAVDSVRNSSLGHVDEWVAGTSVLDETGQSFGHAMETIALHTVYTYPAASGQLTYNAKMYLGTIVVDQTVTYVIAPGNNFGVSGTFVIVTTTATPLQFDPSCQADPQYTSGALQSVVAGHITTTTYHGCGVPPTIQ